MAYLTAEDKAFFKENGYLVVRGAVEPESVDAALDRIWESLEEDRNDPGAWVRKGYRTVPVWQRRRYPRYNIRYRVFAMGEELVGKDKLNTGGGAGPHINFPDPDREWREPMGHLDGYHTPNKRCAERCCGVPSRSVRLSISTRLKTGWRIYGLGPEAI